MHYSQEVLLEPQISSACDIFLQKFIDHIVDIIKCDKKGFLVTFGIVIDGVPQNYDKEKDDIIVVLRVIRVS